MRDKVKVMIGMALFVLAVNAQATNYFSSEKKQTWFYGVSDKEPQKKDENVTKEQKPVAVGERREDEQKFMRTIPFGKLDQLTAKQYREMLEKTKEIATMHLSEENVATYMRLQKFSTDQADKFSTMWKKATIQDPSLTYSIPTSKSGRDLNAKNKDDELENFLKNNQKNVTFVMFYDGDKINDVRAQVNVYRNLEKTYGMKIATVSIQKNPEYIKTLELQSFPEHWIYFDDGKMSSWQRVGSGFITTDVLVNNFYFLNKNKE